MAGGFDMKWIGVHEVEAAIARAVTAAGGAQKVALRKMASDVQVRARNNFQGTHKKGARHVGGAQPNVVTGNLRRSVQQSALQSHGAMEYSINVYVGAVYARAVELGNPARHSRAFPFFAPAVQASEGGWGGIVAAEFSRIRFR